VTVLSMGMTLVRNWLPVVMPARARAHGSLALEIRGTVTITRAADHRIEASIAARILVARRSNDAALAPVPAELLVEDRGFSAGALADARPFLWFQLVDGRGVALSHEMFIGRGVEIEHNLDARVHMAMFSGLHARIVARTYRNTSGPRYHSEVLALTLLGVGSGFPAGSGSTKSLPPQSLRIA